MNVVVPPAPAEDLDLDVVFQSMVSGVSGLAGLIVRPRWQSTLPKQPEPSTDWCAIGVMSSMPDAYAYVQHLSGLGFNDPAGDLLIRHEELEVLASFYGPHAKANAGVLRDGLYIQQNVFAIAAVDIAFTETGPMRAAPDFINQQWIRRFDVPMRFRRKVSRLYQVNNIVSATVHVFDDSGHVNRTVSVP
jgi:hypothetical protein